MKLSTSQAALTTLGLQEREDRRWERRIDTDSVSNGYSKSWLRGLTRGRAREGRGGQGRAGQVKVQGRDGKVRASQGAR